MPKLIIPIGPAGCGKTTWWRNHIYSTAGRISADNIRFTKLKYPDSGIDFDPQIEPEVWQEVWEDFIKYCSVPAINIYLDCTNLTQTIRNPFIHVARSFGYTIEIVWFKTSLFQCLLNNKKRERHVPEDVIARQFLALQPPEGWEYDTIIEVN